MSTKDKTTAGETQESVLDFLAFLSRVDKGRTGREAGARLQELVAAVQDTGRGGVLTVRVDVKPTSKVPGHTNTVQVTAAVATKIPALPKRETTFFITDTHDLSTSPTDQHTLDF